MTICCLFSIFSRFIIYKQNKQKKKNQKDFLTNTVCLHILVRKFTFIFLSSVLSNQLTVLFTLSLGLYEWAEQWSCEWGLRGPSSSPSLPPLLPLRISSVNIWNLWSSKPNQRFGSSSLGIVSSFCISCFFSSPNQQNKKQKYTNICAGLLRVSILLICKLISLCYTSPLMPIPVC